MNQNHLSTLFFNSIKKTFPILFFLGIQFNSSFAQVQTQTAVSVKVSDYLKGYYESLPVDYKSNSTKKYPLLIFLHGVGERGNGTSQLPLVLKNGVPKIIKNGQFPSKFRVGGKDFSFIVISPQYSSSTDYVTTIWKLIEHCKKKYRVDEKRVYITGLSMGGLLAWNFSGASKANADAFAAMVTVCGGGVPTSGRVGNVASAKLPVWVTNNSGDPYNPASRAKQTVDALNAYKPAPPKAVLTIFQKGGHDAWTQSYDPNFRQGGLNVYEWMLSYTSDGTSQPAPSPAPPVAKAGANQTITLPVNSVTLSGSGSTASSGTIKSYSWKKISGPSQGIIGTLLGITTKITGLVAGVYKFELTVTDSNGNSSTATVTITVNAAVTAAPTAKVGSEQTITLPTSSVTVDASASTAASGAKIKTYAWTKISGPAAGKITSAGSAKTTITGLTTAGYYKFQVKVTDDKGKTATATVTIVVKLAAAVPPTAKAGSDQTITLPANNVTLDGSASKAAAGNAIKAYAWTKKSGPSAGTITAATAVKAKASGLTAGTYVFQLKVTDNNSKSALATVTVVVKPAPVVNVIKADAGADQEISYPASSVKLDGSKSTAGSAIKSYAWKKVSGPKSVLASEITKASAVSTEAANLVPGTYVFQLKITDAAGNIATDNVSIMVKYKSGALKANAGPDQTVSFPLKQRLVLDGSESTAPATGISCSWSRISGPGAYGAVLYPSVNLVTTTAENLIAGVYKYQLTIRDEKGNVSTDVLSVTVKSPEPEVVLKANAGPDQTITSPSSTVKLDGSLSIVAKGSSIKKYTWYKISGPMYAWDIVSPNSAATTVNDLVPGVYRFRLKVIDNKDKEEIDDVVINVNYRSGALKANAGPDLTITLPAEKGILLNGSASTTPGGSSDGVNCSWTRLSGPGSSGAVLYPSVVLNTNTGAALSPGVYQYQLTLSDAKGNTSSDVVKITVKSAVSARSASGDDDQDAIALDNNAVNNITATDLVGLKINPNPVKSDMTVWVSGTASGKVSMLVYNLQGRTLMQQEFQKDGSTTVNRTFNLSQLPAGSYIVQVVVDGKHRKSMQIIKQ